MKKTYISQRSTKTVSLPLVVAFGDYEGAPNEANLLAEWGKSNGIIHVSSYILIVKEERPPAMVVFLFQRTIHISC